MGNNIVHVIGTGTIGEPLVGLLAVHKEDFNIDEVTFHKNMPYSHDRPKLLGAAQRAHSRARAFDSDRIGRRLARGRHRIGARVERPGERSVAGVGDRIGRVAAFADQRCNRLPRVWRRERFSPGHCVGREPGRTLGARPTRSGRERGVHRSLPRGPECDHAPDRGINSGACSLSRGGAGNGLAAVPSGHHTARSCSRLALILTT